MGLLFKILKYFSAISWISSATKISCWLGFLRQWPSTIVVPSGFFSDTETFLGWFITQCSPIGHIRQGCFILLLIFISNSKLQVFEIRIYSFYTIIKQQNGKIDFEKLHYHINLNLTNGKISFAEDASSNCEINFSIIATAQAKLNIKVGSGNIDINNILGVIDYKTGSRDVTVTNSGKKVEGESEKAKYKISVKSGSGDIDMRIKRTKK
ncbi:MAG: hypothetical protein A2202_01635 [Bdellovibrionales bacterium RIFOXYA1_FULL_36_14]|nr:MAG: hypothetical protein A2202_01635 [Bdellovibrionales bacterium RIFOXYA1_FULL_36_14]